MCPNSSIVQTSDPINYTVKMTGVDPAGFKVVALHESQNLLEEVAKLINRQWPRSIEAR